MKKKKRAVETPGNKPILLRLPPGITQADRPRGRDRQGHGAGGDHRGIGEALRCGCGATVARQTGQRIAVTSRITERRKNMQENEKPVTASVHPVVILRLNLKRKWWEQIRDGEKTTELRKVTEYWRKRLVGRYYDEIHLCLGYPRRGDDSKILKRKWKGHFVATVKHEEFGPEPVDVFCINVAAPVAG